MDSSIWAGRWLIHKAEMTSWSSLLHMENIKHFSHIICNVGTLSQAA